MPNPFFSARIPPDLSEKIKQHIAETGESKTEILIKALAAYVNHPIETKAPVPSSGVSLELFSTLEQRVIALEQLLQTPKEFVISVENNHNQTQPEDYISSNSSSKSFIEITANKTDNFDVSSDLWLDVLAPTTETKSDNGDSTQIGINIKSNEKILLLAPPTLDGSNHVDNTDNNSQTQSPQPKYELLTSPELRQLTGMVQFQVDNHKRKVNEKHKKLSQPLVEKKLLKSPEKITTKKPITVNDYPYDLFYLGQNRKGKDLWTLILSDNSLYQELSLQDIENIE